MPPSGFICIVLHVKRKPRTNQSAPERFIVLLALCIIQEFTVSRIVFHGKFKLKRLPRLLLLWKLWRYSERKQLKTLQRRKSPLSSSFFSPCQCSLGLTRDMILYNKKGENYACMRSTSLTEREWCRHVKKNSHLRWPWEVFRSVIKDFIKKTVSCHKASRFVLLSVFSLIKTIWLCLVLCLVPVRPLLRPSRSMHFVDVSETTWPETHREIFWGEHLSPYSKLTFPSHKTFWDISLVLHGIFKYRV